MVRYSEKYEKIGQSVINELFPKLKDIPIAFLVSDQKKKKANKIIFADCRTISDQYEWCCHYDFMITVYEPNAELLSDDQTRVLLEHELLHCGFDQNNKPMVLEHDIEEFRQIIDKYGVNWADCGLDNFDFDFDF